MFDKRLMQVCPESKKYIIGNIMLQFLELVCNTIMIIMIARNNTKFIPKQTRSITADIFSNCDCSDHYCKIFHVKVCGADELSCI